MVTSETARDQYDRWASTYDQDTARLGWIAPAELAAAVAAFVPPASWQSVVDLGVGTGQASRAYREAGARVVGIDVSPAMLEQAAADPRFHALVEHDLDLGLPASIVRHADADLVIACGAVHFLRDLEAIVSACREVLVPGGVLAFTFIPEQGRAFGPHTRTHRGEEVTAILARAGFVALESRELVAYYDGVEPIRYGLVVARDARPHTPWPAALASVDRTACVDRDRLRSVIHRVPWVWTPSPTAAPLVPALAELLARGEPDLRAMAWPTLDRGSPSADARCTVVAVMPHPDDESIYAGGTIAGWTSGGASIELVVATAGAAGRGGSDLATRRAAELVDACTRLGVRAVACLGWPDIGKYHDAARTRPLGVATTIAAWGLDRSVADLVRELRVRRPRVVLTLDPEIDPNLSLHAHHLALGWLVAIAFHLAGDSAFAPELGEPWAAHELRVMSPALDAAVAQCHAIDAAAKSAAVAAHRSQTFSTSTLQAALARPHASAYEWCRTIARRDSVTLPLVRVRRRSTARAIDGWHAERDRVLARPRSRGSLVAILRRQASAREPDAAIETALAVLERSDAVTVVTGQQVGLLGGPALTLSKALSAVAWARRITAQGIPAVPVFWMASQDHDLDEVATVPRLGAPSLVLETSPTTPGVSVGRRMLGPAIDPLVRAWLAALPTPPSPTLRRAIDDAYAEDASFAQAFARLLAHATRGLGLVILDPEDRALASLARDVFARELFGPVHASTPLAVARARLERGGEREVVPTDRDLLQLFWADEQRIRRRLRRGANGVETTDGRVLTTADLVQCLELVPERLTPAALLRPIVQDAILPTIAYVAGPTERRYLAQTDELYAWAEVPQPRVVLRGAMRPFTTADVDALVPAGGMDALDRGAGADAAIGRAGLEPHALDLHDRILEVAAGLEQMRDVTASWRTIVDDFTRAPIDGVASEWPRSCALVDAAMHEGPLSPRVIARAHRALDKLAALLRRGGRRRASTATAAWQRVADAPVPAERRMTTAEALVRFSDALPHTVLAALDAEPDAQVLVQVPTAIDIDCAPVANVAAVTHGRYGVLALGGLGGSGRVAWDVARGLGERGHHVVMLAAAHLHWASDGTASIGHVHVPAPQVPTPAEDGWVGLLADAIVHAVMEHRLHALSVHYAVGLAEAAVIARDRLAELGHALRVCVTLHGSDVTVFGLDPPQRDRLRSVLRRVDEVTAVSRWLSVRAQVILDLDHAPRVVPNAVDTGLFFPTPPRVRGAEAVLCHASNFRAIKRPLDGIDVLAAVAARGHAARLEMIGDGPLHAAAIAHARDTGLAARTSFVGAVAPAALASRLRSADIVLVTSESESFSLVALEAMASGAVLVGTRCGGVEELLARAESPRWADTLLAAPGDVAGLADRVAALLADPDRMAGARAMGIALSRSGFAQHEQIAAYAALLRGDPPA
jgi:N-acetyl-alpha-D-glucosaminyl L-malate synthase BshA